MNEMEEAFKAQVQLHGKEIEAAQQVVRDLSEKYGIPYGSYVPKSLRSMFSKQGTPENDWEGEYVSPRLVEKLCSMDDGWLSSTVECEFYGGY